MTEKTMSANDLSSRAKSLLSEFLDQLRLDLLEKTHLVSPELQELTVVLSKDDPADFTLSMVVSHYALDFSACAHGQPFTDAFECDECGPSETI